MALYRQPDLTAETAPDETAACGSNDDLEVEPVATLRGDAPRCAPVRPAVRVERLRRLALQLHAIALEEELERKERQLQQVRDQYETALERRTDGTECVVGTWSGTDGEP